MRIVTIASGVVLIALGGYLIANESLTFISVAFIIGLLFMVCGVVEVLSHSAYRGADGESKAWVLIDGLTTFSLGMLIFLNKISAEIAAPQILGLWVLITGIRNAVKAWENLENKNTSFYDHLLVGLLNLIVGFYVFFDPDILALPSLNLVGLCIIVQGINLAHVGITIKLLKPEAIKTKEEMVTEAALKAKEAQLAAREALEAAKAAQSQFKEVALTPAEMLDKALRPKPVEEGDEESAEQEDETGI